MDPNDDDQIVRAMRGEGCEEYDSLDGGSLGVIRRDRYRQTAEEVLVAWYESEIAGELMRMGRRYQKVIRLDGSSHSFGTVAIELDR